MSTTDFTPPVAIGDRLRVALARKGWNQSDLVRAAGVDPNTISSIINSQRRPRPKTVAAIEDALGMDRGELQGIRRHAPAGPPVSDLADRLNPDRVDTDQQVACKIDIQWRGSRYPAGPFTVAEPGSSFFAEGPADLVRDVLDLALAALDHELARGTEHPNARSHIDSSISAGPESPSEPTVEGPGCPGGDSPPDTHNGGERQ